MQEDLFCHTETTPEREESQTSCLSYPERKGGQRSQIAESTEIYFFDHDPRSVDEHL